MGTLVILRAERHSCRLPQMVVCREFFQKQGVGYLESIEFILALTLGVAENIDVECQVFRYLES